MMRKIELNVFGEEELINAIRNGGIVYKNVISIADPGSSIPIELKSEKYNVLPLRFLDLDKPFPNHDYETEILPTIEDIHEVETFLKKINIEDGITIHCWQGLSRSTAVAICVLHHYLDEQNVVIEEIFKIRPYAKPNVLILKHFDEIHKTNYSSVAKQIRIETVTKMYKN
jgi:predicted protein tyrosine phosphatase